MAILKPDSVYTAGELKVNKYYINEHNVNRIDMPSKRTKGLYGITVHNTDWINVSSETTPAEQYTRACVNGNLKSVRVHYYVDDKCAWQNLDDSMQGWHAADGSGNGNTATISIECIMRNSTDSVSLASRDNCAKLVAYLLVKYGLTINDVYTHTYWLNVRDGKGANLSKDERCCLRHTYKTCPLFIIPYWNEFISQVQKYYTALGGKAVTTVPKPITTNTTTTNTTTSSSLPYKVKIKDDELNVRADAGTNNKVVTTVKKGDVYTIVAEKTVNGAKWGKLKSGIGWMNVSEKYCTKV